ncbi:MAG: AMP-binding protein [Ardenticatenaceae bacterium]|nr:AMP-binding protein [Anaerolineales bacterium]MCB8973779.1 AMP-binding protein [Ardenticatenaceae bacterium]
MDSDDSLLGEYSSLIALLQSRATHQPHQVAFTFLQDGELEEVHLTYQELDKQARAIGALLQSQGAAGERALLLYPPGLEYIAAFFGCLYAGVIAVPVYPPKLTRLDRSLPRLQAIANNARPSMALTTSSILDMVDFFLTQAPDFQTMRWLATDAIELDTAVSWQEPKVDANTLAFLQYTSGSTSLPKGVMVSHGNLLQNQLLISQAFGVLEGDHVAVGWLPLYHDMGLIGNVIQTLYTGLTCILMSPLDFLQKPIRWLQAVSRYRATFSGGPNFAYDLCVRKTTPEQRAGLDLRNWQVAFNGAEPIRTDTLERFANTFAPYGFRREAFLPCYGLAEATLLVSGGPPQVPPVSLVCDKTALEQERVTAVPANTPSGHTIVGCGQTWAAQRVTIVNPETKIRCEANQSGEIWIAGSSVAQGYWQNDAANVATFQAFLADTGEGPFLRTGDLGFVRDGQLYVTGRLKDLIIIRGRNHAPQDIELTVEKSHQALRPGCGVAFSVEEAGEERLVVVQEVQRQVRDPDVAAIAAAVRQAVVENHELQVYAVVLLKPGGVPKTSSGKLQRRACRADYLADSLERVIGSNLIPLSGAEPGIEEGITLTRSELLTVEPAQQWTILSAYLRKLLAQSLKVPVGQLGLEQPFTSLGLDSLMALELKARIETDLEVKIPLVTFMEHPTIAQITDELWASIIVESPDSEEAEFAAHLLAQLDSLSDEEVEVHLQQLMAEPG